MFEWLSREIAADSLVITANHRLARHLVAHFNDTERARGLPVWQTPAIRSLDSWLLENVSNDFTAGEGGIRLGSQAAGLVWERCIPKQRDAEFLSRAAFIREARQAWAMLQHWDISLARLQRYVRSADERLFLRCAQAYEEELATNGWLDDAGIPAEFCRLLSASKINAPARVVFAGFDRKTPAFEKLLECLRKAGTAVKEAPQVNRESKRAVVAATTTEAELRAAGGWARELLLREPQKRVAIVVPGLEQNATRFARLIREGLVPGWQSGPADLADTLNISYGRRLGEFPLVATALLMLRWLYQGLSFADISILLRSPFIARHPDAGRHRAERKLRDSPDRPWTREGIVGCLERIDSASVQDWVARLRQIERYAASSSEAQLPGAWAKIYAGSLEEAGWPGERSLGSKEFQLVNRWRQLLNDFARLDSVSKPLTSGQAIDLLTAMANEAVFQPESVAGAVNLLGILETAGMEFDAVWCAGMDATRWPVSANPVNLLPRRLQVEAGMPDATPEDSLAFGRILFDRLTCCADEVTLSWAQMEDEAELLPSPFLAELQATSEQSLIDPGWYAANMDVACEHVDIENDPVPPVGEGEQVGGGAYTIQQQRTEPLGAFAAGRLAAEALPRVEPGITAAMRGRIVHRALQNLYQDKPSQDGVASWREEELAGRIEQAAQSGVARYLAESDAVLRRLLFFEKERLEKLLGQFIKEELNRPPFSIAAVEKDFTIPFGSFSINVRIDRIDRLGDGGVAIIDYKTGAEKKVGNRNGEISHLQLAVYACAFADEVRGLVLANLDTRRVSYTGAGDCELWEIFREDAQSWKELLERWKSEVRVHAELLAKGDARINIVLPTREARALAVLSRVAELKRAD